MNNNKQKKRIVKSENILSELITLGETFRVGLPFTKELITNTDLKKYGIDNPNIKILEQLKAAGIKINGCAQSMLKNSIEPAELNANITPIFSRFTTVATYQLKGYAYFKY